jgi:hypothetical protein
VVGGGMTGISRSSFIKWHIGNREEVIYDERVEKYFVIREFSSPNFIEQVNFFIEKVYEFKEGIQRMLQMS